MPAPKDPEKYKLWKERISEKGKNKKVSESTKQILKQQNSGKQHSSETKLKLKIARRMRPIKQKEIKQKIISKNNPEIKFENIINQLGLREHIDYKKQYRIDNYRVDFFLIKQNLIIEINGCFWHQCAQCGFDKGYQGKTANEIRKRDENRLKHIASKGYSINVIWCNRDATICHTDHF